MRTIKAEEITRRVATLCIEANTCLPADVKAALEKAREEEPWPLAKQTLGLLRSNLDVAAAKELPICQDTGMACVFVELGQDVHVEGDLEAAVNEGVRRGYGDGYLRKSVVGDPLRRVNTGDNTPAFLTLHLVPGEGCRITVAPKGAGSENMSRLAMLKPADGEQGVKDFILDTVKWAGSNPCARWMCPTRTPTTPRWNRSCWRRSTSWASALRASAATPPLWALPLKPCPPMWPACPWP